MTTPLSQYLAALRAHLKSSQSTEHTYRLALEGLLKELVEDGIAVTNEPGKIEGVGMPDFVLSNLDGLAVGYVETKQLGASLDKVENTEQLKRYRAGFENLLLTNYLEMRHYRGGVLSEEGLFSLGALVGGTIGSTSMTWPEAQARFSPFVHAAPTPISTPEELAKRLAARGYMLCGVLEKLIAADSASIKGIFKTLKDISPALKEEAFADMLAQTLCYGLFAARIAYPKDGESFNRVNAQQVLPGGIPLLSDLFQLLTTMSGADQALVRMVDDTALLLAQADMHTIMQSFGKHGRSDPILHFYEDFLSAYNPKLRAERGVYYTPDAVVGFMVQGVHHILQTHFGLADGLADHQKISRPHTRTGDDGKPVQEEREVHRTTILDPATGTGTFLRRVMEEVYAHQQPNLGAWPSYVKQHLLPRLFGFEWLMAPYTMAHLNLGAFLSQTEAPLQHGERVQVYLTNTLESPKQNAAQTSMIRSIAEESAGAARVKTSQPIMVVLGNPPYHGASVNKDDKFVKAAHERYKIVQAVRERYYPKDERVEKNIKGLQDDYVKFILFAQQQVERNGKGVVAFITNHGYLSNPTFRGMRQSLLQAFDEIYLLDLHGNARTKETTPGGEKDENVFAIMQGVAISFFIKRGAGKKPKSPARVLHADLWGRREPKLKALAASSFKNIDWQELQPSAPWFYFYPRDNKMAEEYEKGWGLNAVFPLQSAGLYTARDSLSIHFDKESLEAMGERFCALPAEEARAEFKLPIDVRDWKVDLAQADLRKHLENGDKPQAILYRPFDTRFTFYTGKSKGFHCMPRSEIMEHMLAGKNVSLVFTRQSVVKLNYSHISVASRIVDYNSMRGPCTLAPLYTYPTDGGLPNVEGRTRQANLDAGFIQACKKAWGLAWQAAGQGDLKGCFGPEDVLHYAYAVLHSPTYRTRYAQFLREDFPRLPLCKSPALLAGLCAHGASLVALHLMQPNSAAQTHKASFPKGGSALVEAPRYVEKEGRVYINQTQYFAPVPPAAWGWLVGGYTPLQKWLKDRKNRTLDYNDIAHYGNLVAIASQTLAQMQAIDATITKHGGWPLH